MSSTAARHVIRVFAETGGVGMRGANATATSSASLASSAVSSSTSLSDRIMSSLQSSQSFATSTSPAAAPAAGSTASLGVDDSPAQSNKGFLAKAWDRYSLGQQQHRIELGERLFRSAQRRADDLTWFTAGHIGGDFRPRHALLTMHVWFLHRRLLADKVDPHKSLMVQEELFDVLWNDSRSRIRAEGVNELTVNKHLKDTQQVSFQQMTHLDHAFTEYKDDSDKRTEEIALAVWMHLLMKDEGASDDMIKRLAAYVEYEYRNVVLALPDEYFQEGRIDWGSMPDFNGMKDKNGKTIQPLPLNSDDVLPEDWVKALTDAGDMYYWNTATNLTTWQRPT
mmetsp:Transcript_12684/g.21155  ORF Transcript_12684/g.21155 Transcript_12684/m.21155 type:complete len:338 (-) Transcript_12684:37-1050(-)